MQSFSWDTVKDKQFQKELKDSRRDIHSLQYPVLSIVSASSQKTNLSVVSGILLPMQGEDKCQIIPILSKSKCWVKTQHCENPVWLLFLICCEVWNMWRSGRDAGLNASWFAIILSLCLNSDFEDYAYHSLSSDCRNHPSPVPDAYSLGIIFDRRVLLLRLQF